MRSSLLTLLVYVVSVPFVHGSEPLKQDLAIYRDAGRYAAFPSLMKGAGDRVWVNFGWNTTRSHYGKVAGGKTGSESFFSPDGGRTWHRRGEDKAYQAPSAPLNGLVLSDGACIKIGPRMHEIVPNEKKKELVARGVAVKEWPDGHGSASYRVFMSRGTPGSPHWKGREVALPPFADMRGFGKGCVLSGDVVLHPVYGLKAADDPLSRAWVLRSTDRGETWELVTIAHDGVHDFTEPELLRLPTGRVIAMIRVHTARKGTSPGEIGYLWQTCSDDQGKTWSTPKKTEMWGYPADLRLLRNGDLLCTYGYRREPYGIRACFSRDGGETWDAEHEVVLRDDALSGGTGRGKGHPGDLGYPHTVELADGALLTVYYITLDDGVTHIAATRWSPDWSHR